MSLDDLTDDVEAAYSGFGDDLAVSLDRETRNELALLETVDTGKPSAHARGEVEGAIDTLDFYASMNVIQTLNGAPLGSPASPDDLFIGENGEPLRIDKAFSWEHPLSLHGHHPISRADDHRLRQGLRPCAAKSRWPARRSVRRGLPDEEGNRRARCFESLRSRVVRALGKAKAPC